MGWLIEGAFARSVVLAMAFTASVPVYATSINFTYSPAFAAQFGPNTSAAQTALNNAAAVFTSNFTDNININIFVQGFSGASVRGDVQNSFFNYSWAQITGGLQADAKSADDLTATSAGGSADNGLADPVTGPHSWWTTRAEAKALGLIPDDTVNDGIITFGGLYNYDFNPADGIDPGAVDFEGAALYNISAVMGRTGLSGGTVNLTTGGTASNAYSLIDALSYLGPNARGLTPGANQQFSIDNGATMLQAFNDPTNNAQGGGSRDWAGGVDDAFNAFGAAGVVNAFSAVDLQVLDVLGYDIATNVSDVPEPSTGILLVSALVAGGFIRRRAVRGVRH